MTGNARARTRLTLRAPLSVLPLLLAVVLTVMPVAADSQTTLIRPVSRPVPERASAPSAARTSLNPGEERRPVLGAIVATRLPDNEHQMTAALRALDREAASGRLSLEEYRERLRQIVGHP